MIDSGSRLSRSWFLGGLVLLFCGCDTKDADKLARMGKRGAARLQIVTGDAQEKLHSKVQSLRGSLDDSGLESRVSSRLRWDKLLAEIHVDVSHHGRGVVELKGAIQTEEQRNRAMGLAFSTSGVEKVIDSMARPVK